MRHIPLFFSGERGRGGKEAQLCYNTSWKSAFDLGESVKESTDLDRKVVREIILGYFELFENDAFTRQHIYDVVIADRDMPKVEDQVSVITQEFDRLMLETKIQVVGGVGDQEKIKLRRIPKHRFR